MDKYAKLAEKIRSMNPKEIVLNMIDGLENPVTKIDMGTFGRKGNEGICYGCAATNAICRLGGLNPEVELGTSEISYIHPRYSDYKVKYEYNEKGRYILSDIYRICKYEKAIDHLRVGDLYAFNFEASLGEFQKFSPEDISIFESMDIPPLDTYNYSEGLIGFKKFAEKLNYV